MFFQIPKRAREGMYLAVLNNFIYLQITTVIYVKMHDSQRVNPLGGRQLLNQTYTNASLYWLKNIVPMLGSAYFRDPLKFLGIWCQDT